MGGRLRDPRTALGVALALGLAVRLLRVVEWPLIHPDGPAYLALARSLLDGEWSAVLGGYYSPLYPITIAPLVAVGLPAELAARLVASIAGVLALPLLFHVARRIGGDTVGAATVLVAALHPALVKAAAQVQPETLAGLCLLAWGAVLMEARDLRRAAVAGMFAAAAYLARPEGIFLVVIGIAWLGWRRRPVALAVYVLAAVVLMAPAVLALHERTGTWQISRREAALTVRAGLADQPTLAAAVREHPGAMLGHWTTGVARQAWNTAVAIGPVLALPFFAGLYTMRAAWPLAVAAAFVIGPLALNPSPRYAVPILPLFLPWAGAGILALVDRLGRRGASACGLVAVVLIVQSLWPEKRFDENCSREVSDLVRTRYGTGQALVAVDGRFAYLAEGRAIVPKTTRADTALTLARTRGARLWLTRPWWLGKTFTVPPDVHEVARPCSGAFILFEIDTP